MGADMLLGFNLAVTFTAVGFACSSALGQMLPPTGPGNPETLVPITGPLRVAPPAAVNGHPYHPGTSTDRDLLNIYNNTTAPFFNSGAVPTFALDDGSFSN